MKKVVLGVAILATIGLTSCKNEAKKDTDVNNAQTEQTSTPEVAMTTATFGVRGNCGMCKNTIEKAVNEVEGVASADWDKLRKQINVSFDDSKTNLDAIHNAIAASGYDTDKVAGSEEAYSNLPNCCQYDHDMEMSLQGEVKADETSNH
ncbi:heavy-metal-associated domain-containing protein [Tenacibaculum tangerinum]|uniref:Heavy-metal-associated domain-containing protein n=1 Tax=Tenacibaculum tangerinum TaxID=3038772 RepID=A0ABY8L190_9FLAO|nr:heavy-metal-associated domain-containing protein [Tenacibaculum tangerinum]WGH75219.1 heavy-metal-associated domain-containing protein [Tenacibaculum tangerinum]